MTTKSDSPSSEEQTLAECFAIAVQEYMGMLGGGVDRIEAAAAATHAAFMAIKLAIDLASADAGARVGMYTGAAHMAQSRFNGLALALLTQGPGRRPGQD